MKKAVVLFNLGGPDKLENINEDEFSKKLNPIYKAISKTSANPVLKNKDLIGFVGAPWTI